MIINNLEELKAMMQKVMLDKGFIEFCKECPIDRCCKMFTPTCDYVINDRDCLDEKRLNCYFYICPVLNEKDKEIGNWLQRVRVSVTWPNKLEFPIEIEEFKEIENESTESRD